MAVYYFRNTGDVNRGTSTNRSTSDGGGANGAVPGTGDDAIFSNQSGNCTVNTSDRNCKILNFTYGTGYTGTFNMSFGLNVYGDILLGAGMTFTATSGKKMTSFSACSITNNGITIPSDFGLNGTGTRTLVDDMHISGTFYTQVAYASPTAILNGNKVYLLGGLTGSTFNGYHISGTTVFEFSGSANASFTGTVSNGGFIYNTIIINKSGGTLTMYLSIKLAGAFTYTAGTVNAGTSNLRTEASGTYNISGITLYDYTLGAGTCTLGEDLNISNLFTTTGGGSVAGGKTVYTGSLTNGGSIAATTTVVFSGSSVATWSGNNATGPIVINKSGGTLTLSGTVGIQISLTYTAGTVITTSSTLNVIGDTSMNCTSITFNNVTCATGSTAIMTLLADFNCSGTLTFPAGNSTNVAGAYNIYCGPLAINSTVAGQTRTFAGSIYASGLVTTGAVFGQTNTLTINGAGTINCAAGLTITNTPSGAGHTGTMSFKITGGTLTYSNGIGANRTSSRFKNPLEIDGNITMTGTMSYSTGTFKYTSGNVTFNSFILSVVGNCTFNTAALKFPIISMMGGLTAITLSSTLNATILQLGQGDNTFAGTYGFSVDNLYVDVTAANTLKLVSSLTYTVSKTININSPSSGYNIKSTSVGTKSILSYSGVYQSIIGCNITDIDSSGGLPLYTINIGVYTPVIATSTNRTITTTQSLPAGGGGAYTFVG